MKKTLKRGMTVVALLWTVALLGGCYGNYSNSHLFLNGPDIGQGELNLMRIYGIPNFTTVAEGHKIYGYKVREVNYYGIVGIYEGYDLLITCRDGQVVEHRSVLRPQAVTVFAPPPWAVTD